MSFYKNTACGTPLLTHDQKYKNNEIGSYLYIDPKSGEQKSIRFRCILTRYVECNQCIFGNNETGICNQIAIANKNHSKSAYIHPLCLGVERQHGDPYSYDMIFKKI